MQQINKILFNLYVGVVSLIVECLWCLRDKFTLPIELTSTLCFFLINAYLIEAGVQIDWVN